MNRFEALHALGLEENATEDDVRLAYYGLEKAVNAYDFSDSERIAHLVEGMLDHAKEARAFLLKSRNQSVARKVMSYSNKQRGKVSVSPMQEKQARLHGLTRLREMLISYLYGERSKRRTSIFVLIGCIVVSFISLRIFRGAPRIVAFTILGAVAIAGSTVLTSAQVHARKAKAHVLALDEDMGKLRTQLGLDPETGEPVAAPSSQLAAANMGTGEGDPAELELEADDYEVDE